MTLWAEPAFWELVLLALLVLLNRRLGRRAPVRADPRAEEAWVEGLMALLDGRYTVARGQLGAALERAPEDPEIRFDYAEVLRRLGEVEEAHRHRDHAVRVCGLSRPRHRLALGEDLLALGRHAEALPHLRAAARSPRHRARAQAALSRSQRQAAGEALAPAGRRGRGLRGLLPVRRGKEVAPRRAAPGHGLSTEVAAPGKEVPALGQMGRPGEGAAREGAGRLFSARVVRLEPALLSAARRGDLRGALDRLLRARVLYRCLGCEAGGARFQARCPVCGRFEGLQPLRPPVPIPPERLEPVLREAARMRARPEALVAALAAGDGDAAAELRARGREGIAAVVAAYGRVRPRAPLLRWLAAQGPAVLGPVLEALVRGPASLPKALRLRPEAPALLRDLLHLLAQEPGVGPWILRALRHPLPSVRRAALTVVVERGETALFEAARPEPGLAAQLFDRLSEAVLRHWLRRAKPESHLVQAVLAHPRFRAEGWLVRALADPALAPVAAAALAKRRLSRALQRELVERLNGPGGAAAAALLRAQKEAALPVLLEAYCSRPGLAGAVLPLLLAFPEQTAAALAARLPVSREALPAVHRLCAALGGAARPWLLARLPAPRHEVAAAGAGRTALATQVARLLAACAEEGGTP